MEKPLAEDCPCASGRTYAQCCQPYLAGTCPAPTAESLMRSRYTAFVLCDEDYLRYSWHPDYCPVSIHIDDDCHWLGLKVVSTEQGTGQDRQGRVHFIARYKRNGKATRIEETSRFERYQGRWVYLDGNSHKSC